ncbi:GNAT family N-acetyltransferase [Streptomyces sp. NPDC049040]|uniref:GNAT family N-acetyltransferase n=1 Tax=Streptomyces sp. NPDC049040 TaxID=3365593 RepID=UPI003710684D
MISPIVRAVQDADIAGAAAALVEVHATDGYPVEGVERPKEWIRSSAVAQAWVAEIDRRIVGHVAVMNSRGEDAVALWHARSASDEAHVGVLARLFVVREARGRAVGETLVRAAMDYARQRSMRLVLDVMTKDAAAIRLYERMGWLAIGRTTHRYGDGRQIAAVCYVSPAG